MKKLAVIYWYTIENGIVMEDNRKKAFGAAIITSIQEIDHALGDTPEHLPLDCFNITQNHLDSPSYTGW